jgi:hypothetical protein
MIDIIEYILISHQVQRHSDVFYAPKSKKMNYKFQDIFHLIYLKYSFFHTFCLRIFFREKISNTKTTKKFYRI